MKVRRRAPSRLSFAPAILRCERFRRRIRLAAGRPGRDRLLSQTEKRAPLTEAVGISSETHILRVTGTQTTTASSCLSTIFTSVGSNGATGLCPVVVVWPGTITIQDRGRNCSSSFAMCGGTRWSERPRYWQRTAHVECDAHWRNLPTRGFSPFFARSNRRVCLSTPVGR